MTADLADLVHGIVERHKDERGPLLPILHELRHTAGFVPPEAVPILASELNLSRAEVYGVVTFYRDFRDRPAGRVVRVCRAEACQAVGGEALAAHARARLGDGDGQVRFEEVFCLGNCALGPSVEADGKVHGLVGPDQLDALIDRAARASR